jgi:3-isopropylmalate/(R)-2-methylmalate dehydratase large subunit
MPMTVVEKILARAAGRTSVTPGEYLEIAPTSRTVLAAHNGWSKGMPEIIANGWKLFDPERVMIVDGHLGASASHRAAQGRELTRRWMAATGIPSENFVRLGRGGIENMVAVERCWALPGDVYLQGANGHISTAGGLGAFACALSYETLAYLVRGKTWIKVPPTLRVNAVGEPPPGVYSRDVSESLLRQIGPTGAAGAVIEWGGDYIDGLSMDGRLAICSQALFSAGWTSIVNPDDTTIEYVRGRTDAAFEPLVSDTDARYWKTVTIDVSTLDPVVVVPPTRFDIRALDGLVGRRVTKGFIGSDAGGWLDDLRVAARVLEGKTLHGDVVLNITPGTVEVLKGALREGLLEIFLDAGCVVPTPNEGMECGYNSPLECDDVCIASGQTNYPGRMGSETAEIYLANAAVVAASCVEGRISDPRPSLVSGLVS